MSVRRVETGWNSAVTVHDNGTVSLTRTSLTPTPMFLHLDLTAAEVAAIRGEPAPPAVQRAVRRALCPSCGREAMVNAGGVLRKHYAGVRAPGLVPCPGSGVTP